MAVVRSTSFALVIALAAVGCSSSGAVPGDGASVAFFTPSCASGAPELAATTCGGAANAQTALLFATPDASVLLCAPGPGCASSTLPVLVDVGFGQLSGTVPSALATLRTGYPGLTETFGTAFTLSAVSAGTGSIVFSDPAESQTQSVALTVLAAPHNDGSLTLVPPLPGVAGQPGVPCDTAPFTVTIDSAPGNLVTGRIADPSIASVTTGTPAAPAVTTIVTSFVVTPAGPTGGGTALTVTSGANALVVPLNVQGCAVPG